MTDTDIMETSMDTSIDDDTQIDKIERIKSRMVEKRKKAAKLASMNGSWNKSFGKKRRCPNASVVLKASLKSNNRALAKSLQTLKQENRMAQDMIIDLQNEQQVLIQKVYQQRQNEKEDMRIRKEIQTALGDVTTSLLMAGNRLAYAMEMTTKVPIRESLLRSSSVQAMSSDDDSICLKQRQSSLGASVYYRKPMSTGGLAPVPPVNEERPASRKSTNLLPKSPLASEPSQPVDAAAVPMETDREIPESEQDPEDECLDPSMMKDLDFDIPMMFTDDDVTGKIDVAQSDDEDGHSIKRRTRSSRTSGFVNNLASASSSKSTSKGGSSSRMEPVKSTSVNPQSRVTFVFDQQIREDQESSEEQISSVTEEKEEEQPSNILNQTFEIEEKPAEKSTSNEKSIPGEKTSHKVVDMELTMTNQNSSKESNDESPTVDETCPVEKAKEANNKKSDSNITKKKKSKLPLKKAKTKVNLKKKDRQETFQSPKSPLMSPGVSKSSNGFSFRCVPSPVFDRPSKRQPVPSKPVGRNKHDTSLSSVFDLSEGDTFTEAKSVLLPPEHETILECSDKMDSPMDKDETNKATDLVDSAESQPESNLVKLSKTKVVKKKSKASKDEKITKSVPSKDQVDEIGEEEEADARKEDEKKPKEDAPVVAKTKRSKKSSKSVASSRREDTKTQKELNDKCDGNNQKTTGKKKSAYFPFEEEEGDAASSFFITKPMIHKKKKDDKKNNSNSNESGTEANEDNPNLSLLSDFMLDISSALSSVQKMNQNLKQDKGKGKRKKKRSSIPIFTQNKSIMASRLDAALVPLENTLENTQDVTKQSELESSQGITKQPKQETKKLDGESEINQQEPSSTDCQMNKAEQCNDKVEKRCEIDEKEDDENITGQSETTEQEGTRSRRSRISSVIQPTKSRKGRRVIESEEDSEEMDSESITGQSKTTEQGTRSRRSRMSSVSPVIQPTKGRKGRRVIESEEDSEEMDSESITGQSKTTEQGTRSRRSRMSSVSPVIQPTEGRKGRRVIESEDDNEEKDSESITGQSVTTKLEGRRSRLSSAIQPAKSRKGRCIIESEEDSEEKDDKSIMEQSETAEQEGTMSRSRMSSVSPVIQPTKGRKGRRVIESEEDSEEKDSESVTEQRETTKQEGTKSRRSRLSSAIQPTKGRKGRCIIESDEDSEEKDIESITGQGETTEQEGAKSRRSRISSVSPVIQPSKGHKRRHVNYNIESEDDSEEEYQQEKDDDNDSDVKPKTKSRKSAVTSKRKRCRVSFNVEALDEASESDTDRKPHKKPRKDNHKTASKTKTQDSVIVEEKKAVKSDKTNKVRSTKVKTGNEENAEDNVAEKRHLKNCIKKRSSVGEKKTTQRDSTTSAENVKVDTEVDQKRSLGGRRTSRRAASAVNYKEPTVKSKLRRGDAFTSNDYLADKDIYKGPADVKKGVKKAGEKNRKPLRNVQNTIVKEEISCESSD